MQFAARVAVHPSCFWHCEERLLTSLTTAALAQTYEHKATSYADSARCCSQAIVLAGVRDFMDQHSLAQTREYLAEGLAGREGAGARMLAQQDPSFREVGSGVACSGNRRPGLCTNKRQKQASLCSACNEAVQLAAAKVGPCSVKGTFFAF